MFDEIRSENRANNRRYFEVFVRADADLRALRKPMLTEERGDNHVTAEARSYQLPSNADLVLENAGDRSPLQLAECIVVRLLETTNVAKPRHS
jgi:adenylylsulfate kinase-like enzyme